MRLEALTGIKRLVHPEVGELRLAFETLQLPDLDEQRLVVWLPADDGDRRQRSTSSTGATRERSTPSPRRRAEHSSGW